MGLHQYKPDELRLFIDSSKKSLKYDLLNDGNKFASVTVGHSLVLKEHYHSIKMVSEKFATLNIIR